MHFQFLIEDPSGEVLIRLLMQKVAVEHPEITMDYKSFHGIGGFSKKKGTVREMRTGKLLNDLSIYLSGFNKSFQHFDASVFIVIDNDDRNPEAFKESLRAMAREKGITIDHVFCLAIEEIEAWLLGDEAALFSAYPKARRSIHQTYVQDSICGTWEKLADVVYPGGSQKLKKDSPSYAGIGKTKIEWASRIGEKMDIRRNASPSFNYFIGEIFNRLTATV